MFVVLLEELVVRVQLHHDDAGSGRQPDSGDAVELAEAHGGLKPSAAICPVERYDEVAALLIPGYLQSRKVDGGE